MYEGWRSESPSNPKIVAEPEKISAETHCILLAIKQSKPGRPRCNSWALASSDGFVVGDPTASAPHPHHTTKASLKVAIFTPPYKVSYTRLNSVEGFKICFHSSSSAPALAAILWALKSKFDDCVNKTKFHLCLSLLSRSYSFIRSV